MLFLNFNKIDIKFGQKNLFKKYVLFQKFYLQQKIKKSLIKRFVS